ncbi:bifunctional metallophosphatase/5'-nucleotidase [Brevibacillus composti]|uniref:Bifunctional metallophosphatase/5'-nucleotidase n=1 Tax=Brevibacillus composti TaxID=2796470 RepID=A0A7T5EIN3_9BACL|nr:bifunctional UDP-sugar hydrolase/5'-nucleotidase [Brevibacillus composti]QQE73316.1 bifunctional metallophosphatase/5'-nucleotidase [Brevibacillus composti]QUO40397.1 bifunctional metallophosphatase/5'-nucleotidase [Brevibacillus composti]
MKKTRRITLTALVAAICSALMASSVFAAPLHPVQHVDWMVKKSIVTPGANGDLALERNVTLAEAVVVFAKLNGSKISAPTDKGSHWSAPYMAWARNQGAIAQDDFKNPTQTVSSAKLIEVAKKLGYELTLENKAQVTRGDFFQALGEAATTQVTIAHANDVHGHIVEDKNQKEFGYAKIATLVNEWRKENENFLLLDAGDTFQGTVYVNQFQGESVVPILNHLGFNMMAAGNHEFDFGYEQLLKLRDMLKHPIVSANVIKEDGKELLTPVYKVEIGGKTFAIFSIVAEDTPILTHPDNVKGLTFKNPVEVAKALVPELKKEADHVIALTHVGVEVDREIAKNVPGIDLIIGGHSHTKLDKPEIVNGTYILQDWEYGKSLGRADLYYLDKELVAFSGGIKEYDESVQADPEVEKMVQEITQKIDEVMNVVIAKSEVPLDGDRSLVRKKETNVGNLITDIMLERTKSIKGYEADVALTNAGGIRTQLPAGDITKKGLYTLLPFPNTLVVVEVTGEELKQALENGVGGVEKGEGRFAQISGMSFTYNPNKPAGERVIEVKVGGQPLDLNKTYKVATNDFLASGGDGYVSLQKPALNTGLTLYSIVEEELIKRKTINPQVEGRIVEVTE